MNLKKAANVKNIICLAVVAALGVGIIVVEKNGGKDIKSKNDSKSSVSSSSSKGETVIGEDGREKVILSAEIPELSCESIDFGENVVFADTEGNYSFMENGSSVKGIAVQDDSGAEIVFSKEDGKLVLTRDDQPAAGFVYENHMIVLKDGKLYIDSSPVEYKATSFSSYRLSKDYVIECTDKGKYRLKDNDGKITLDEMFAYAKKQVKANMSNFKSKSWFHGDASQTPCVYAGYNGGLVLFQYA